MGDGVAPLQALQALCLVCARVCVCVRFPGLASKVPGREDPDVSQGKDSKDGPSSTRIGSADYGRRPDSSAQSDKQRDRQAGRGTPGPSFSPTRLQLMGTRFVLVLKIELPIMHRG